MAKSRRTAQLHGTREAARLHEESGIRETLGDGVSRIDVFGTIVEQGIPLIFRPLDNLLGAYIPGDTPGVIVSTKRPLSIQRFTAAHELGHCLLGHHSSLDTEEMLARAPFGDADYDFQEMEADAFAAEFLVPYWLLMHHAAQKGWNADSMKMALFVYQMSLRVGVSYHATCYALLRHNIISYTDQRNLLNVQRRDIKSELLSEFQPESWFETDVWELTVEDEGTVIEGGPNDLFIIRLNENSGAGYLWNIEELRESGFAIVEDYRDFGEGPASFGGDVTRIIAAQASTELMGDVRLHLARPWEENTEPASTFEVKYNLSGKERGLPRAIRHLLEAG